MVILASVEEAAISPRLADDKIQLKEYFLKFYLLPALEIVFVRVHGRNVVILRWVIMKKKF